MYKRAPSHILLVPVASVLPRRATEARDGRVRRPRAADTLASEDRMRLVAALLVLGTLLVWILVLQG